MPKFLCQKEVFVARKREAGRIHPITNNSASNPAKRKWQGTPKSKYFCPLFLRQEDVKLVNIFPPKVAEVV
jgi:hypothetical protein